MCAVKSQLRFSKKMLPKKKIDPHERKMPVIQLYNIRTKVSIFLCEATC